MTASRTAAIASNPCAPTSSAKPLAGNALGVTVGVLVGAAVEPSTGAEGLVAAAPVAASVCASAAWVSNAFTVAVAGSAVNIGVIGVSLGSGVSLGGGSVSVLVADAVKVKLGVALAVRLAVEGGSTAAVSVCAGAAERCAGRITRA